MSLLGGDHVNAGDRAPSAAAPALDHALELDLLREDGRGVGLSVAVSGCSTGVQEAVLDLERNEGEQAERHLG
jgi:hypothetical protein